MSIIARIPGPTTSAEFTEKLRTAITQNKAPLDRVRTTRAEQQASRTLREQQDSAYQRSLAQDRERARQRREAEAERQRVEEESQKRQAAAEKLAHDLALWQRWRSQSIPNEPPATDKDSVRISIRLASGQRVVRRFSGNADLEELYAFVECYDILHQPHQPDDEEEKEHVGENSASSLTIQKPKDFEHKYGFRLVSPMPRVVYEIEAGGSVRERIGRGGNLVVEVIEDGDEDGGEGGAGLEGTENT